jgi:CrcB protein
MTTQTLSARRRVLAVLCGGFIGTITRYLLSQAIQSWLGKGWPYDILAINLTGALLFAIITTLAEATLLVGPTRRLLFTTGFLGAYTTFSSLALGDVLLFSKGELLPALLYLILSLSGGLCAILAGDWLGHLLAQRFQYASSIALLHGDAQHLAEASAHQDDFSLVAQTDELETKTP